MKKWIISKINKRIRRTIHYKYCCLAEYTYCWEDIVELQRRENIETEKYTI